MTPRQTPRRLAIALALAVAANAALPLAAHAQATKPTLEALEGYFDFVDANAGTLLPEQIPAEDYKKFHVIDVRDAGQFAQSHVPGAVNIEWRQVFAQRALAGTALADHRSEAAVAGNLVHALADIADIRREEHVFGAGWIGEGIGGQAEVALGLWGQCLKTQ